MSEELEGNCLVAQSGGPTSVINASLAGVVAEALNHECIEEIYGGVNGVLGILNEQLIDLAAESQQTIRALRHTPGAALGTCRFKLKSQQDYDRVLQVFEAHNIRYFFYAGGNDSQDTADKISKLAQERGYQLRVIGVPKTIDNDLVTTDHTPGYGSVIKYIATTVKEIACDNAAMGQYDLVQIIEVMGRSAGWIAAGAALAKSRDEPNAAPHLIYLPEVAFSPEKFISDVQHVLQKEKYCVVVVGEGLVDDDGNYISTASKGADAFGHSQLGGAGEYLRGLVEESLQIKARSVSLGMSQRAAAHCSSQTDNDEAYLAGQAAVEAAIEGHTDKMVTLVRGDGDTYTCETGLAPLSEIANGVKKLPESWINEDGVSMNYNFYKYALPLIQGEVEVPYENGVPTFAKLKMVKIPRKLGAHSFE
ncbi:MULTISPECIES: 6-phosphofructokinase [unclassified Lentimonas]|uniref:6-phosphofructokinase n=1 Tax=unclassified Lentimonas TaxID=2630993 RepID=UPI00132759D3|nr:MULTISPECIES: 6-phosphofructokinase [unclassified Lentimonas]CAA6676555.1 6-phosphofructokinase (EC [Lentimonas sp. CC4]CAA6685395.1 6-phosphofructokinase (EC [Lentimonas sp. CC6]CAA6691151.1 6-phosphofructokinase (EC [Lentimonas sp. CC10]CAA6693745.1 6-phosphofructokinase (EC [Lentimonas sp. CC19]CAA7070115.1 6-phosphofructokinase (EC [Lentimonas sp. CC11]